MASLTIPVRINKDGQRRAIVVEVTKINKRSLWVRMYNDGKRVWIKRKRGRDY